MVSILFCGIIILYWNHMISLNITIKNDVIQISIIHWFILGTIHWLLLNWHLMSFLTLYHQWMLYWIHYIFFLIILHQNVFSYLGIYVCVNLHPVNRVRVSINMSDYHIQFHQTCVVKGSFKTTVHVANFPRGKELRVRITFYYMSVWNQAFWLVESRGQ